MSMLIYFLNINFLAYVSLSPLPPPAHCVHTLSQAQFLGRLTFFLHELKKDHFVALLGYFDGQK